MDMDQVNTQNSNISIRLLSQEPAEPKIKLKQVEGTKMSQLTFTGCFDYDVRFHYNTHAHTDKPLHTQTHTHLTYPRTNTYTKHYEHDIV